MSLYEEKRKQERENPNIKYVPVKPVPVEGGGTVCVNVESKSVGGGVAHLDVVADTPDDLGRINDERMAENHDANGPRLVAVKVSNDSGLNLERINDIRMAQGLEAIPTKAANEAANGQRDLLPADDGEAEEESLLERLEQLLDFKGQLDYVSSYLADMPAEYSPYSEACEDDLNEAYWTVDNAIETISGEVYDLINNLGTIEECVTALGMNALDADIREAIAQRLLDLAGAR